MKFHDTLNDKIWDLNTEDLIPEVKEKLEEIAEAFIEFLEIPTDAVLDKVITGSSASYNYNKYSDLDLHIIVDYDKVHEDCPLVNGYLNSLKKQFNDNHDITIHGVPVELYAEQKDQGTVHNGLYSLQTGWIDKPQKIEPTDNDAAVEAKFNEIKELVDKCDDSEEATELLEKIYTMRKAGLAEAGEFCTENLAFKKLRNEGCMNKLRQIKKEQIDKQLSLESYNEAEDLPRGMKTKINNAYKDLKEATKEIIKWCDTRGWYGPRLSHPYDTDSSKVYYLWHGKSATGFCDCVVIIDWSTGDIIYNIETGSEAKVEKEETLQTKDLQEFVAWFKEVFDHEYSNQYKNKNESIKEELTDDQLLSGAKFMMQGYGVKSIEPGQYTITIFDSQEEDAPINGKQTFVYPTIDKAEEAYNKFINKYAKVILQKYTDSGYEMIKKQDKDTEFNRTYKYSSPEAFKKSVEDFRQDKNFIVDDIIEGKDLLHVVYRLVNGNKEHYCTFNNTTLERYYDINESIKESEDELTLEDKLINILTKDGWNHLNGRGGESLEKDNTSISLYVDSVIFNEFEDDEEELPLNTEEDLQNIIQIANEVSNKNEAITEMLDKNQTNTIAGILDDYEHGLITKEETLERLLDYSLRANISQGDLIWCVGKEKWDHLHNIMTGNPELDDELDESIKEEFFVGNDKYIIVPVSYAYNDIRILDKKTGEFLKDENGDNLKFSTEEECGNYIKSLDEDLTILEETLRKVKDMEEYVNEELRPSIYFDKREGKYACFVTENGGAIKYTDTRQEAEQFLINNYHVKKEDIINEDMTTLEKKVDQAEQDLQDMIQSLKSENVNESIFDKLDNVIKRALDEEVEIDSHDFKFKIEGDVATCTSETGHSIEVGLVEEELNDKDNLEDAIAEQLDDASESIFTEEGEITGTEIVGFKYNSETKEGEFEFNIFFEAEEE